MKRVLFFFIGMITLANLTFSQVRMSSGEISYRYNQDHSFIVNEVAALEDNNVKAYFQFILNSGNVRISDFVFSYYLRKNYLDEGSSEEKIKIDTSNIADIGFRQYIFKVEIERASDDNLLVFDIYDRVRDKQYYVDVPLVIGDWKRPPFIFMNVEEETPYFGKYALVNSAIRPVHLFNPDAKFEMNAVTDQTSFPMPPFEDKASEEPEPIPIDTLYGVNNGEVFTFHNEGIYEFSSPQADGSKLSMLVTDEYYPYYKDYEELVKPLIFISTNDEFQRLRTSDFPRDAFEEFVNMSISNNQRVSKGFIKGYYQRIRKSARLFSADRQGWKTDRGMIFQIYGNPQQVLRNETTELWIYSTPNGGRVRYIFDILVEDGEITHKLIRGKRYREDWMQAVTQWRTGRVIE